jgi:hypothetical protein
MRTLGFAVSQPYDEKKGERMEHGTGRKQGSEALREWGKGQAVSCSSCSGSRKVILEPLMVIHRGLFVPFSRGRIPFELDLFGTI